VPEQELDLFQFTGCRVTQPSAGPPEIERKQSIDISFAGVLPTIAGPLFRQTFTLSLTAFFDTPKQLACKLQACEFPGCVGIP
jgi:hypothetical protein